MEKSQLFTTEDKQKIRNLPAKTLRATSNQRDLERIRYEKIGEDHEEVAKMMRRWPR